MSRHHAELVAAQGYAGLVPQRLVDSEAFLIPPLGLLETATAIGRIAEQVVVLGNMWLVA